MTPPPEEVGDLRPLFEEYRVTRDRRLRNQLIEANLHLASFYVRKFSNRGVADDDLQQIALLAILHAVERFDPEFGVAFSTFASRTIEGEVQRYFRDRTWSVRPPRSVQELHLQVRAADNDLSQRLGRPPSVAQIADHLGVELDDVLEALEASGAHQAMSLDTPSLGTPTSGGAWHLPIEGDFERSENQLVTRQLLEQLPEREQQVIYLSYFENLSQSAIAERIGVSQSYLSRLLRESLSHLRALANGP